MFVYKLIYSLSILSINKYYEKHNLYKIMSFLFNFNSILKDGYNVS